MFFVDTNIFLHAVNTDSPDHKAARQALETYANGTEKWGVTWGILYEYLRVATHPKVFPKPLTMEQAYAFAYQFLKTPGIEVVSETQVHQHVLETSKNEAHRLSGNLIHDFHIAVLMREHGVSEIVTLDTDFKAFPWVRIKPLR